MVKTVSSCVLVVKARGHHIGKMLYSAYSNTKQNIALIMLAWSGFYSVSKSEFSVLAS